MKLKTLYANLKTTLKSKKWLRRWSTESEYLYKNKHMELHSQYQYNAEAGFVDL